MTEEKMYTMEFLERLSAESLKVLIEEHGYEEPEMIDKEMVISQLSKIPL